ncbi:MAG: RNA polymerase sigma factor, partial [Cytophagaceae bacterium]
MKISEDNIPDLIREGKDREVVPVLYKKVLPLVEKYIVSRKGNKEDAYDVFQDALLLFYKQVIKKTFNPKYKVYGYIFRICINLWINKIRKDKRIDWTEELPEMTEDFPEIKEDLLIRRDENIVKQVFAGIGEKCIELLTFTIYESLPLKEVM